VRRYRWLVLTILFVIAARLAFYATHSGLGTDFDQLYYAARHLVQGENPYPISSEWSPFPLFYPLPAVFVAIPFTLLPVGLARPAFDICSGSLLAFTLWRFRGPHALLGMVPGAYLLALAWGQSTPLVTGASLVPALGFLLLVKPNQGIALFAARPTTAAVLGALLVLGLSLLVLPSWPLDWWEALHHRNEHLKSLVARPFGWVLLLAALRWRTPEGRLLLAASLVPQTSLPYELVPLILIPRNAVEMGIFAVGSWMTCGAFGASVDQYELAALVEKAWPVMLVTVYLPMLYLVLRRPSNLIEQGLVSITRDASANGLPAGPSSG
jgi:hypothetical protein